MSAKPGNVTSPGREEQNTDAEWNNKTGEKAGRNVCVDMETKLAKMYNGSLLYYISLACF